MQPRLATIILAVVLLLAGVSTAEDRIFRNADGGEVRAKLLSGEGDIAKICRTDGTVFRVRIHEFSKADRLYIKRWVEAKEEKALTRYRGYGKCSDSVVSRSRPARPGFRLGTPFFTVSFTKLAFGQFHSIALRIIP